MLGDGTFLPLHFNHSLWQSFTRLQAAFTSVTSWNEMGQQTLKDWKMVHLFGEVVENTNDRYKHLWLVTLDQSGKQWYHAVLTHHHPVTSTSSAAEQRQGSWARRSDILAPSPRSHRLDVGRQLTRPLRRRRPPLQQSTGHDPKSTKRLVNPALHLPVFIPPLCQNFTEKIGKRQVTRLR